MMIPANPGGGWDTTGRALGKALIDSKVADNVTYDNKGGAAGALGLAQFVNASKGDPNALMVMGAVMLGGGIWAMHFLGMLAFRLECGVAYSLWWTLLSIVPGVAAAMVALRFARLEQFTAAKLWLNGAILGAGVGLMHYTGMAAIQLDGVLRYKPDYFALSIVAAVLLGVAQTLAWASSYYLPAILAGTIARDVGTSSSAVFGAFSVALLMSAAIGPFAGKLIDRRGGRPVLIGSNLVFAAGLAALSQAQQPLHARTAGRQHRNLLDHHAVALAGAGEAGYCYPGGGAL